MSQSTRVGRIAAAARPKVAPATAASASASPFSWPTLSEQDERDSKWLQHELCLAVWTSQLHANGTAEEGAPLVFTECRNRGRKAVLSLQRWEVLPAEGHDKMHFRLSLIGTQLCAGVPKGDYTYA